MRLKPVTVLLVEDSSDYVALVQRWLAPGGDHGAWSVSCTNTLQTTLGRLAKGDVGVILLDLSLPDCDGARTYEVVRSASQTTPIIVLSGLEDAQMARRLVQNGAQEFIGKRTCKEQQLRHSLSVAVFIYDYSRSKQALPIS